MITILAHFVNFVERVEDWLDRLEERVDAKAEALAQKRNSR